MLIYKKRKQTSEGKHTSSPKGTVDIVIIFYEALYEEKQSRLLTTEGRRRRGWQDEMVGWHH